MVIKRTLKKIFGQSSEKTNDDTISENNITNANIELKLEGSTWKHRHVGFDWHSMSRPHPPTKAPSVIEKKKQEENNFAKNDIICKFVKQGDKKIGETIALDSNNLIFKVGSENYSIPLSSVIKINPEDVSIGEFDRNIALSNGEEWTKRTTDRLNFDDKGMLIND